MLKLSKGGSIKLSKDSKSLSHIIVGMGWEVANAERTVTRDVPIKSIGNFFRKLFGCELVTESVTEVVSRRQSGYDYDLDASCALFDSNSKLIHDSVVYYGHKFIKGIIHGGDNLTGSDGMHDDETIDITLSQVNAKTDTIAVFMNIYCASSRNQSFADLTKAYLRIINADSNEELCRYDLTQFTPEHTALVLGFITHEDDGWKFTAIGESLFGNYPQDVTKQLPAIIKKFKQNNQKV